MSDFRGMGILSLHQLVHFSAKYPVEAQACVACIRKSDGVYCS